MIAYHSIVVAGYCVTYLYFTSLALSRYKKYLQLSPPNRNDIWCHASAQRCPLAGPTELVAVDRLGLVHGPPTSNSTKIKTWLSAALKLWWDSVSTLPRYQSTCFDDGFWISLYFIGFFLFKLTREKHIKIIYGRFKRNATSCPIPVGRERNKGAIVLLFE